MGLKIYLAGFDVFRLDAKAHGERLKALCESHGHQGLYPLDNDCPAGLSGPEAAQWIYRANVDLIRQADVLVANLNNFRGLEPDSGTAFEVGYAVALGKPVWGYLEDHRPLHQQVLCTEAAKGHYVDAKQLTVENFGLPRNLMLACAVQGLHHSLEQCLASITPKG
ncbi:nucleoside 2-deoxyribosyltransferase [Ideonella paludis]|uniref:Nucleoside 2-deoxyribosyltransferase n=1 Tax=Ideonella paludis TaxID=1233411 RepID=A0ABS5E0A7_9BURK|nr:nucleoside 2-deoxyribosyltransferase [Ideonella paludis]